MTSIVDALVDKHTKQLGPGISAEGINKGEHIFILRGHPDGGDYGDPISWSCTVVINGDEAFIHALVTNISNSFGSTDAIAIRRWLRSMGITHISWGRSINREMTRFKGKI